MKQFQWFAVRCCCTPLKVFGFLRLEAMQGMRGEFRNIKDIMGTSHPIKLVPITDGICPSVETRLLAKFDVTTLEFPSQEIAIYSEDRPLEFWRTIPGFVEATNVQNE